jgi:hypothetical protein
MKNLSIHPCANIFPLMEGAGFDALVADIKDNGLREPLVVIDDQILDGRNRQRACEQAGVPIKTVQFDGDDPLKFVISTNLHRRHLNASQRAMIAARLWMDGIPEIGLRGRPKNKGENSPLTQAAAASGVSVDQKSLKQASEVQNKGIPALSAGVESGAVAG